MRVGWAFGVLLAFAACSATETPDAAVADVSVDVDVDVGAADAGPTDADVVDVSFDVGLIDAGPVDAPAVRDAGADCTQSALNLEVVSFGDTERYYVLAEFEGETAALQLDTGSGLTFIFTGAQTPNYTPNVGDLIIGCESLPVAGRGFDAPGRSVAGHPVVGLIGMDFLLRRPSLLEVEQRRLTRFQAFPAALVADRGLYETDFESVADHVLIPLRVDGTQLRLLFDTGGGHTLWVGQQGRPGDTESLVQDFKGNTFPIYTGSSTVSALGGPARQVQVARAPMFPYFEDTVRALGGNIQGLAGVTSFPGEALLFSGAQGRLYVLSPDN